MLDKMIIIGYYHEKIRKVTRRKIDLFNAMPYNVNINYLLGNRGGEQLARISIEYDSTKIEKLFGDNCSALAKVLDKSMARKVQSHLANLKAAANFYDFVALGIGKPHPVDNILSGCYGVRITANVRLILEPISDSRDSAWLKQCCVVRVKGVCDYHGGKANWYIP